MAPLAKRAPGAFDYALLTTLAVIFGSSFLFTNIAVQTVPPFTVVASRILLATVAILAVMQIRGESLPKGAVWGWILASSVFGMALPFTLIAWGQKEVDAGLTGIFMAIMPLATVLLAHVSTVDEKLNRWTFIGVLFGLAGVTLLMGWQSLQSLGGETLSQLAILIGAVCYSVNAIITRKLTHLAKWPMSASLLLGAAVIMVPLSLYLEQPWQLELHSNAVLAIVALAIGPTAIATWMILIIIGRAGASFLSQINFLVPLFGVLLASVFLHERLPADAWLGLLVILVGVALARVGGRLRAKH